MISPVFLNCTVELFTESHARGASGQAIKTLTPWVTVRGACDLKGVRRQTAMGVSHTGYTAKVFVDGPKDINNRHWARLTDDVGVVTIFGQVSDCRNAGLIHDNIEFVIESGDPTPPIVVPEPEGDAIFGGGADPTGLDAVFGGGADPAGIDIYDGGGA